MAKQAKNLTPAAISRLPSGKDKLTAVGHGIPGLYIRTTKHRKSFQFRYPKPDGNGWRVMALGTFPATTLEEALDRGRELRRMVERGEDPKAKEDSDKGQTFATVATAFVQQHCIGLTNTPENPNNRGWRAQQRYLGYFTATLGHKPLREITKAELLAILRARATGKHGRRPAPGHADRVRSTVRKFFKWAQQQDYLSDNPALTLPTFHKANKRDRVLTDDELRKAWAAAENLGEPHAAMFKLLVLTGCRLREVTDLSWAEVDLDRAEIRLPRVRAKNDTAHVVYLSRMAVDLLRGVKRTPGSPFVFTTYTTKGEARPADFWTKDRERLRELAELDEDWRLHDLRRTFSTNLQRLGVPFDVREKCVNHTLKGVAAHYEHYQYEDERRRAVEALAAAVQRLLHGEDFVPAKRSTLDVLAQYTPEQLEQFAALAAAMNMPGSNVTAIRAA